MGKIFCLMGKSASGKDTLYKMIMDHMSNVLKPIVQYTDRPIRKGELNGVNYHFVNRDTMDFYIENGKCIENRSYNTHPIWRYATIDDGIDLLNYNYFMISTLEAYLDIEIYFGKGNVIPIYLYSDDGERLIRSINRERKEDHPCYTEICERFLRDERDFSEKNLDNANINIIHRVKNESSLYDAFACIRDIIEDSLSIELEEEYINDDTEIKIDNNKPIIIGLHSKTRLFGYCTICFDDTKSSIDSINVYLYNTDRNTHYVIENPLFVSITNLINIFNDIGVKTDIVGNFENHYNGCRSIEENNHSDKTAYSIADLIDILYCSLPDDHDKDRMLFPYRSYFDIILKKLIPGYYIVDPISNVQAIPIEANDMVKKIDDMFKRIQHLSMALGITGSLLTIFIIWIISYLS